MENERQDVESLKFERTASGKYVYAFKLLGKPEDNLARQETLTKQLNDKIDKLNESKA